MRYRRVNAAGATFFFTLVTERRRPLFREPEAVSLLLGAVEKVRSRHPFEIDAYVVLPDHLHTLWTLPDGDANFSTRWRLIKETFTRAYIKTHEIPHRSESRRSKGEQASGNGGSGSTPFATKLISRRTSITSISIQSNTDW
jgi:REP-associated tyrosine transposase